MYKGIFGFSNWEGKVIVSAFRSFSFLKGLLVSSFGTYQKYEWWNEVGGGRRDLEDWGYSWVQGLVVCRSLCQRACAEEEKAYVDGCGCGAGSDEREIQGAGGAAFRPGGPYTFGPGSFTTSRRRCGESSADVGGGIAVIAAYFTEKDNKGNEVTLSSRDVKGKNVSLLFEESVFETGLWGDEWRAFP